MRDKVREIPARGVSAPARVFVNGHAVQAVMVPTEPAVEPLPRTARQTNAATATPSARSRIRTTSTPTARQINAATATLARLRQNPAFEANRIAALRISMQASWTPERRAEARAVLLARNQDQAFRAKQSNGARKNMQKLNAAPEFQSLRQAAKRRKKA